MLAARLRSQRGADARVFFFGPGVRLAGSPEGPVVEALKALHEAEVPTGACTFQAQQFGVAQNLTDGGIDLEPAGEVILRLTEEGYQIVGI